MSTKVSGAHQALGPPVAFNTQDWWVAGKTRIEGLGIVVGTVNGDAFEHHIIDGSISAARKYAGSPIAFHRPIDRWVARTGNSTFMVGLVDGSVFQHSIEFISPNPVLGAPKKLAGPPVAARPPDMHVLSIGSQIAVILNDGAVFAHQLTVNGIQPAVRVTGPPVASRTWDRWVISGNVSAGSGDEIFVITSSGDVWVHQYNSNLGGIPSIGPAHKLDGPPVAFRTQDRWVLMSGGKIVVITELGEVFIHDVS
ncbi:hypothetical protein AAHZ94_28165 [Streptomyces sp. HSW2009]|uniref:hypothetical protein n=1 Tax=Streptomyces sp. HSW2009 TaxID=3142890 RepID=UPI0032EA9278